MAKPDSPGGGARGLLAGVVVALGAVAALAVCVAYLDARRQDQLAELSSQLDTLRQLVDSVQQQLEQHEDKLNSTLHAKSTVSSKVADEVIYEEEEYDYDSYEYDEEEEPSPKATVKRTTVLSESDVERNSTPTPSRTRRDVSSQSVSLREESATEPLEEPTEVVYRSTPPHHRRQPHTYHSAEYQEQRRPPETVRPIKIRHRGQHGNLLMDDVELLLPRQSSREYMTAKPRTSREHHLNMLAAHFVGDTSHYNTNLHPHYRGNDIMNHPHGFFKDWRPAEWMIESGMLSSFTFNKTNGIFMVKEPGIYFIYAQIFFTARHERSGFYIKKNGDNVTQCMTTTHTPSSDVKRNTCFTAALVHLHEHDKLSIREVDGSRYRETSFKDSHSFFGLIQLKSA